MMSIGCCATVAQPGFEVVFAGTAVLTYGLLTGPTQGWVSRLGGYRSERPTNEFGHECWIVETSKDGERWRFFGKAWKEPGEALLLHAVPRYVRVRPDGDPEWREPLEATDDMPITLLRVEEGVREELWPEAAHIGLPMLLPGGEIGRLLRFEYENEIDRWTYALEFRGSRT